MKKLIASAASRTRNRRVNDGRAWSGNATHQPHVRSRCQAQPGRRISRKREPQPAHVVDRVGEVDVAKGDEEEQRADGDRHQRDQLRDGAGHLPALTPRPGCPYRRRLVGSSAARRRPPVGSSRHRRCPESLIVLEIVHRVDAAARTFLDRAARLVILLRALLVAQALGRRRRTEVRAAIASAGSGWSAGTARGEAAATAPGRWAAEATATATAEAAGTRAAEATAATAGSRREASRPWRPRRTILARARFADRQGPALKRLRVELADDFLGLCRGRRTRRTQIRAGDRSRDRPAWQRGRALRRARSGRGDRPRSHCRGGSR